MKKKRSLSSKIWLYEHFKDPYVKKSHRNNLRSRAWFKLHSINIKYNLFKKGMNVIDLGSYPGSWSQYVIQSIGDTGTVISCDINVMDVIPGVHFIQGDVFSIKFMNNLMKIINDKNIDVVISDMSPKITGISCIDIPSSFLLFQSALKIALKILSHNGDFLVKVFQGEGWEELLKILYKNFSVVKICKPHASRSRSREVFVLAKYFKK
ncbi:RlmE family RNA methyltransferase [Buchnera aphidicola]|uniref:RlmE family RNA methyltransferase n=1 Tax=Buchnera aphidicola TaxID=9 RepID=UPI00346416D0